MKTIEDIKRLAMNEPVVKNYMQYHTSGDMTLEQALIGMVLHLASDKQHYMSKVREYIENSAHPHIRT